LEKLGQLYINGRPKTSAELKFEFDLINNFLLHHCILASIPNEWKILLRSNNTSVDPLNHLNSLIHATKPSKLFYGIIRDKHFIEPNAIIYWN
jgi:hypothetical protein